MEYITEFKNANLKGSNFLNAIMVKCQWDGADMQNAILRNADLRGGSFRNTNMEGADMYLTDIRGADLSQAKGLTAEQLKYTIFSDRKYESLKHLIEEERKNATL